MEFLIFLLISIFISFPFLIYLNYLIEDKIIRKDLFVAFFISLLPLLNLLACAIMIAIIIQYIAEDKKDWLEEVILKKEKDKNE